MYYLANMKKLVFTGLLLLIALLCSCNEDGVITAAMPPEIIVENGGIYTAKTGRPIELSPRVENILTQEVSYQWTMEGVKVGNKSAYTFLSATVGTFYLTLRVETESGKDEADFRIEVYDIVVPKISFLTKNGIIEIERSTPSEIKPSVLAGEGAIYHWSLDGEPIGEEPTCSLNIPETGDYILALEVENEDGKAEAEVIVRVVERLSGSVVFPALMGLGECATKSISMGQSVTLAPTIEGFNNPSYSWSVDGQVQGNEEVFTFSPTAEGTYKIEVEVSDEDGYTLSTDIAIKCCAPEGTFRREATDNSLMRWNKIYEYTPAAGQFIGEDKSGFTGAEQSAQAAIDYAEKRLSEGKYLSLGAWGGRLIAGFDHSVANDEGADFVIAGNMFDSSSEPAIVWVMQDSNGNGLPDDEWYELRGSEWGSKNHSTRYAVTYFRAAGNGMAVRWRDNRGAEGEVPYISIHSQPSYFPAWIENESYTLYGSRLEMNTVTDSSGKVIHKPYAWGYADNLGEDCDPIVEGEAVRCRFDISNAVAADGSAVKLQYIDFVKIQCAVNGLDEAMGELSTEILAIECVR